MRNPVNAPYENDLYPLPVGWTAAEDGGRVYLRPGNLNTLNDNDARILGESVLMWSWIRDNLSWLANGQIIGAIHNTANGFVNWDLRMEFVCSGAGHTITIQNVSAKDDPRDIVWFDNTTRLSPGDVFYVQNQHARVVSVDYDTSDVETYVTIHKSLTFAEGEYFCYREQVYALFTYPNPFASSWFATGYSIATINDPAGAQVLYDGKIAYWYPSDGDWRFTFRVNRGSNDLTQQVMDGDLIYIDNVSGEWKTFIDLSSFGPGTYKVYYYPDNSDAEEGHRPTQSMCHHCVRDFSNSYPSRDGVDQDSGGDVWFCEYQKRTLDGERRVPDANLAKFKFPCMQTTCPSFLINSPWQVAASDFFKTLINRNIYLLETGVRTQDYLLGRSCCPSLCYLAGMVNTTKGGLWQPSESWYHHQCLGKLIDVAPEDLALDEGNVKEIRTGAIREDGDGVMADIEYGKTDRAGGRGVSNPSLYEDGSHVYTVETQHPARELGVISTNGVASTGSGRGEYAVQRVRKYPIFFTQVKGVSGSERAGRISWTFDETHLHVTIKALARDFPTKVYGAAIHSASVSATNEYLTLQFRPAKQGVQYHVVGEESDRTSEFLSGGNVVSQPPWLTVSNPGGHTLGMWGSSYYKLSRGDSVNFSAGLTADLREILLTCIWAKPFAGDVWTESIDGVAPGDLPDSRAPGVPAFYRTEDRLKCDVARFDLSGFKAELVRDWILDNSLAGDEAIDVHNQNVFPPMIFWEVDDFDYTDYEIKVMKDGAQIAHDFDPANGRLRISKAVLDETNVIQLVLRGDTEQNPYIFTRENSCPAELLLKTTEAHKAVKYFELDGFLTSYDLGLVDPSGASVDPASSLSVFMYNGSYRTYYTWDGSQWVANYTYPESYTGKYIVGSMSQYDGGQAGVIQTTVSERAGLKAYSGVGGEKYAAGVEILSDGFGTEGEMLIRFFAQAFALNDATGVTRPSSNWIEDAYIDIKLDEAVMIHRDMILEDGDQTYPDVSGGLGTMNYVSDTSGSVTGLSHVPTSGEFISLSWIGGAIETASWTQTGPDSIEFTVLVGDTVPAGSTANTTVQAAADVYSYGITLTLSAFWGKYDSGTGVMDFSPAGYSKSFTITAANRGKWNTYDVTDLVKWVCDVLQESDYKLYFVVTGAGPNNSSNLDSMDINNLFWQSCQNHDLYFLDGYNQGGPDDNDEAGTPASVSRSVIDCYRLEYEGISFRRLKVGLDVQAMIDDPYLPRQPYDSSHSNNWPR